MGLGRTDEFSRLAVDLQGVYEGIDGTVGAILENIVEAFVILARQLRRRSHGGSSAAPQPPAYGDRGKQ